MCNLAKIIASAVLMSALGITLGDALIFGAIVGIGYLVTMTFQIAINPVFARQLQVPCLACIIWRSCGPA